jgi:predicted TIM-barrel fold metal-dependent hydrolase
MVNPVGHREIHSPPPRLNVRATGILRSAGKDGPLRDPTAPGLDRIYALLKSGKVYVKVSGAYRISQAPDFSDVAPIARTMIAANPDAIVWGSDWPHPGGGKGRAARDLTTIEPFQAIDDGAALNRLAGWCRSRTELEKILVANPARLYDF